MTTSTFTKTPTPPPPSAADDPRWARIVARDKTADGYFWYSVLTTGVYCRPSCPSRITNPKNVQLHDTLESARATGCRPCKRCNPDGPSIEAENVSLVAKACRIIEESEEEPSLTDLANAIGRSPSYFHCPCLTWPPKTSNSRNHSRVSEARRGVRANPCVVKRGANAAGANTTIGDYLRSCVKYSTGMRAIHAQ